MNALLFQYNISKPYIKICNVSRGLSEMVNCAHELFRGHSHCEKFSINQLFNYGFDTLSNCEIYLIRPSEIKPHPTSQRVGHSLGEAAVTDLRLTG